MVEELPDGVKDPYAHMGVEPTATDKTIQSAYKKKALACHPDKNPDDPDAADKFQRLQKTLEFLLDPVKRAKYDRHLKAQIEQRKRYEKQGKEKRKLREDLEARESAASGSRHDHHRDHSVGSPEHEVKRLRKENIARMTQHRADASATPSRRPEQSRSSTGGFVSADLSACRLRISWSEDSSLSGQSEAKIRDVLMNALAAYSVASLVVLPASRTATATLSSRESAVSCALYLSQHKKNYPFRVKLDKAREEKEREREKEGAPSSAVDAAASSQSARSVPKRPTHHSGGTPTPTPAPAPAAAAGGSGGLGGVGVGVGVGMGGSMEDLEAEMFRAMKEASAKRKEQGERRQNNVVVLDGT
ncbi:unnamed protein product [Vitrella brassicaformis CCMP3155]|uniref:J domain-containing protein n=1 Tax=Vitrella brassicaformis (strain CCMP3155) TaxID=1169540 RepID=A0A0G4ENV1_VITBC|nr:unnamed protein product [Vitrella brassicaformis CCMP3155]|eukprot:CEL99469.1 unnamed protein product [Vitrella brassicaformis CCMP3155]